MSHSAMNRDFQMKRTFSEEFVLPAIPDSIAFWKNMKSQTNGKIPIEKRRTDDSPVIQLC